MILIICAIRDSATNTFFAPFYVPAVGAATRDFTHQINKPDDQSPLYMNPEDFELYKMGEFDNEAGNFSTHQPSLIVRGKDVKKPAN